MEGVKVFEAVAKANAVASELSFCFAWLKYLPKSSMGFMPFANICDDQNSKNYNKLEKLTYTTKLNIIIEKWT